MKLIGAGYAHTTRNECVCRPKQRRENIQTLPTTVGFEVLTAVSSKMAVFWVGRRQPSTTHHVFGTTANPVSLRLLIEVVMFIFLIIQECLSPAHIIKPRIIGCAGHSHITTHSGPTKFLSSRPRWRLHQLGVTIHTFLTRGGKSKVSSCAADVTCVIYHLPSLTILYIIFKLAAFWDATPCSHHHPDDGGSKLLWNVGQYVPDYTFQHPRKTAVFIFIAVRTSNLTNLIPKYFTKNCRNISVFYFDRTILTSTWHKAGSTPAHSAVT
jgi:hypothetical protein